MAAMPKALTGAGVCMCVWGGVCFCFVLLRFSCNPLRDLKDRNYPHVTIGDPKLRG